MCFAGGGLDRGDRFHEVSPPERLVYTFEWDDMPAQVIVETVTFEDLARAINRSARGGRTWWAHFMFTRINIGPTIFRKKIEDWRDPRHFVRRKSQLSVVQGVRKC